jgi:hypothetical protein
MDGDTYRPDPSDESKVYKETPHAVGYHWEYAANGGLHHIRTATTVDRHSVGPVRYPRPSLWLEIDKASMGRGRVPQPDGFCIPTQPLIPGTSD